VCFAVLEIAARIARGGRKGGKEQRERMLYAEHDPLLGWRKHPGARVVYDRRDYRVEVSINGHGLRDEERDYQAAPGVFRILALGDSFVEAFMVPLESTVTQRLERRLSGERCSVEVVNGGTAGYSTDQEYLFFKEEGVRYDPKVVLLFFYYNDVLYNASNHNIHIPKPVLKFDGNTPHVANFPVPPQPPVKPAEPEDDSASVRRSAALEWLATRLERSAPHLYNAIARTGLWRPIRRQRLSPEFLVYMRNVPPEIKRAWEMTGRILGALDRETAAHGARLVVVYIPSRIEVNAGDWELTKVRYGLKDEKWDRGRVAGRLAEIARAGKIPFLDLTPALQRAAKSFGGQPYYETDSHWNARGQDAAAQEIAGFLRGQASVPACGDSGGR
jgi:hypothetical protein